MPRFLKPSTAFWPSLDSGSLVASGPLFYLTFGDLDEHPLLQGGRLIVAKSGPACVEFILLSPDAYPSMVHPIPKSGIEHQEPYQVLGDGVHEYFVFHHVGAFRVQHFHTKGGFDVPEAQLDFPPVDVERSHYFRRVGYWVQKSGC